MKFDYVFQAISMSFKVENLSNDSTCSYYGIHNTFKIIKLFSQQTIPNQKVVTDFKIWYFLFT